MRVLIFAHKAKRAAYLQQGPSENGCAIEIGGDDCTRLVMALLAVPASLTHGR